MRSTPMIVEAKPLDRHAVRVGFEDGTAGDVDLSYGYGRVFESLRDPESFGRLHADADAGTIVWPNDAHIAPETFHAAARQRATTLK
ncbi:MAG: DUF2442 domain-containing protein [Solirubrobacteraceae bacterium]